MADCHDLFQIYLGKVALDSTKRTSLKVSRNANRDRIRDHFKNTLKRPVPKFHGQGSYMMRTGINPLDGDYDIDDGVYLQGLGSDPSTWPAASTVHGWIVGAVADATSMPPKDKARCVRVRYSADYHVDLPSYALNAQDVPLLFETGKAPYESDPRAMTRWFRDRVKATAQIRPLVIYLKGWRDFQKGSTSVARGLALTILAANHVSASDRDDVALVATARAIHSHLLFGGTISKPVTPFEDLAANWTKEQRTNFLAKLKSLVDRGQEALAETTDRSRASEIWIELFGNRFSYVPPDDGGRTLGALRTSAPAVILDHGISG